jgi:membrane protein
MQKEFEPENISLPAQLFYFYIAIFSIPIGLKIISDGDLSFYISSIILLLIPSLWWGYLPKLYSVVCENLSSTDKDSMKEILGEDSLASRIQENNQSKIEEQQKNPYRKEINEALINWAGYNFQVIIFSIFIFLLQNLELNSKNFGIDDKKIFWLFIPICLYSTIFSKMKLKEIINAIEKEPDSSDKKNRMNTTCALKNFQKIILILSLLLCMIITCLQVNVCMCYFSIAAYAMVLMVHCNQYKIELFHRLSFLQEQGKN